MGSCPSKKKEPQDNKGPATKGQPSTSHSTVQKNTSKDNSIDKTGQPSTSQSTVHRNTSKDNAIDKTGYEIDDDDDSGIETIPISEKYYYDNEFHPFVEFPTPHLLRESNEVYAQIGWKPRKDSDGNLAPCPPPNRKADICRPEDFKSADERALQATKQLPNCDLKKLVEVLVEPFKKDIEKTRVIFRWITYQDLNNIPQDGTQQTFHWYLNRIAKGRTEYTDLFVQMCKYAGLTVKRIDGYGKGVDFEVGLENDLEANAAAWTAVLIDNVWRFVNAQWGSCYVTGGEVVRWKIVDDGGRDMEEVKRAQASLENTWYECDEFYFLTDPDEFAYKLMPKGDKSWQLLSRPVTNEEFLEMVYINSAFFDYDLRIMSHQKCHIYTDGGTIDIDIGMPIANNLSFTYRLWISTDENECVEDVDDIDLEHYVFLYREEEMGFLRSSLEFPTEGKFKLQLFGHDNDLIEENPSKGFELLCVYVIHCEERMPDCVPKPKNQRKEWGPGADLRRLGLDPISHKTGLVETDDGVAQLVFDAEDDDVSIMHAFYSNTKTKDDLQSFVLQRKENGQFRIDLKVPERGEYALAIYGKRPGEKGALRNVCTYLVTSDAAADDLTPFPNIPGMECGPTVNNKGKVKLTSDNDSLLTAPESGELELIFKTRTPYHFKTKLVLQTMDKAEDLENYVFWSQETDETTCSMRFPKAGNYHLQLYGKPEDVTGSSHPLVYNFVIQVPKAKENCLTYPKLFNAWGIGCRLLEPMSGELQTNTDVDFRLIVRKASAVVIMDKEKRMNPMEMDEACVWFYQMNTGESENELMVAAALESNPGRYTSLLAFKVISKSPKTPRPMTTRPKSPPPRNKEQDEARKRREDLFHEIKSECGKEPRPAGRDVTYCLRKLERATSTLPEENTLFEAMQASDKRKLRKSLQAVEKNNFRKRLQTEMSEAKTKLGILERMEKPQLSVLELSKSGLSEMKRYNKPHPLAHDVLTATLLLMGELESETRIWEKCRKFCEPTLLEKVKNFDVSTVHPEIAARTRQILQGHTKEAVLKTSAAVCALYVWSIGIVEEIKSLKKKASKARPANLKRQKDIFDMQKKKK